MSEDMLWRFALEITPLGVFRKKLTKPIIINMVHKYLRYRQNFYLFIAVDDF